MLRPQFHVATSFWLLAMLIFVETMFFIPFNKFYVAIWLSCCLLHSVSRPQFDVATSFLLSTTYSWSQLPFSFCDLKLFVFSLSCHDMGFRSLSNRFFSLMKFMSQPQKHVATSFLLILSQPHFLVTTVSSQFSFFH